MIDGGTFSSWTRDLEFFADRQLLAKHWPRLNGYFEASFSRHVTAILARQTREAQ